MRRLLKPLFKTNKLEQPPNISIIVKLLRRTSHAILRRTFAILPAGWTRWILDHAVSHLNTVGGHFLSLRERPKSGTVATYRLVGPLAAAPTGRIAVVIQGPLDSTDDFTAESVRYYRMMCPQALVVVSTWEGESEDVLALCRASGAEVVVSKKPTVPGRMNVNLQAISSRRGIERAIELGASYVAKTRSDQRLYSLHQILNLSILLERLPVNPDVAQHARLVSLSTGTPKFGVLHVSDFFMFGDCRDMLEYWAPPEDSCVAPAGMKKASGWDSKSIEVLISEAPENYLLESYLRRKGVGITKTLDSWWSILSERFLILDDSCLDIFWHKASRHLEDWDRARKNLLLVSHTPVTILDWLVLHVTDDNHFNRPEHLLSMDPKAQAPLHIFEWNNTSELR